MIRLEHVTKTYPVGGGLTVLRDVSLRISPRDYLGILGPSGSGKSSLLYLLGLLDRPSSGRMSFLDQDVATLSDRALSALRGRQIGFVFQAFHLVGHLNVQENVELPLFYQRVPPGQRRRRAQAALTQVHLEHRLHHHPAQLSGGECQRVAIARALVTNPGLILADEPTGNLDSATGRDILELFDGLHAAGATIVVITHDPSIAARIPRIVRIQDGYLREEGAAA
jgi:putative ABC transport system ATP-binding protein